MSIENKVAEMLKNAMRNKDRHLIDTLRMLKTKITEKRTSVGFTGNMTDEIILDVFASYKKSLQKAIQEFAIAGDRAANQIGELNAEIAICDQFLPSQISEETIKNLVIEKIKLLNITDIKQVGKVVGAIMKEYKNQVDGTIVKKIVESMF